MYELLINYIYYLKLKDYQKSNDYHKALNKAGVDDITIKSLLTSKEIKATSFVISYYLNKFDLETLHDKLYDLFGSYKEGVAWLSDNDSIIKTIVLK